MASMGRSVMGPAVATRLCLIRFVRLEYIDANGKLQLVSDPKLLSAAAGCFGLLGIVTTLPLTWNQ